MKCIIPLIFAVCLAACETAPTQSTSHPAAARGGVTFGGGNGSSFETAIVVHARDEAAGVPSEYAYIRAHFPGYHFIMQQLVFHGGRSYDLMTFKPADGKKRLLYFDITEYFGKGLGL